MNTKERVFDEKLRGHCCSESIMNMCLEDMQWSEEERRVLVRAMGAYCGGLRERLACGALCAAKAALYVAEDDYEKAAGELGPELMRWFKERFGAWNCAELLDGDDSRKLTLCPVIIEDTYVKLRDMLEDIGAIS
jgi:hypothetical protein